MTHNSIDTKSRLAGVINGASYIEAEAELSKLRLLLIFKESELSSSPQQAALLTAINTGKRCFKGGVDVFIDSCDLNTPLPGYHNIPFKDCITEVGGKIITEYDVVHYSFILYFGAFPKEENSLRVVSDSWRGGVVKTDDVILNYVTSINLGGILAGSLAVGKAFLFATQKINELEEVIMSAWDYKNVESLPATVQALPQSIWTLGLGHLGQAYLWTFSMLPFHDTSSVNVLLQDYDHASVSNWESSVLTEQKDVGVKKTRVCSSYMEKKGFKTTIVERLFDSTIARQDKEPGFLLCGLDNENARLSVKASQFGLVIDCGLGGDVSSFDQLVIRIFPNLQKRPDEIWGKDLPKHAVSENLSRMYKDEFGCGYDDKGISTSFVGVFASVFVIAELVKAFNEGSKTEILSVKIRDIKHSYRSVVSSSYDRSLVIYGHTRITQAEVLT